MNTESLIIAFNSDTVGRNKLVLVCLAGCMNEGNDTCSPSLNEIMSMSGLTMKQTVNTLIGLEKKKLITIRHSPEAFTIKSAQYGLNF